MFVHSLIIRFISAPTERVRSRMVLEREICRVSIKAHFDGLVFFGAFRVVLSNEQAQIYSPEQPYYAAD